MEDDSPEALRRELERAGQLITELEQQAVYADRDLAIVRSELQAAETQIVEDDRELQLIREERDELEATLRRVLHHWAMYYLDKSPIDLQGERGWPASVIAIVEAFKDHPVGRCHRCGKVAPLASPEGSNEQVCAWPEGCDEEPQPKESIS